MSRLLESGAPAPDFEAPDQEGRTVRLSDFRGRWVLLYFYPKDFTYGCTQEACGFRDANAEFERRGCAILGVSGDDRASHEVFGRRHEVSFPLLADPDTGILEAYGTKRLWRWSRRVSYLIDPAGRIAKVYPRVWAPTHAQEVLEDLDRLQANARGGRTVRVDPNP